ncbi:MAG: MarR family winged helix-turn-helix transcriptional regulator [Acidimicrobiales bacterium]
MPDVTRLPGAPTGVEDRTEEIIEHLFALVDRLRAGFEATVAAYDLSAPQAKALRYLAQAGPVPMRELACGLRCDASNVTGIVDRLEQRGLVERRASPADRRVKSLVVTASGAALARQVWSSVMDGAVTFVGLTDDEQSRLLASLRQLDHGPGVGCWVSRDERV